MIAIPAGGPAVMARRAEPADSLDFFPTPPWATRALLEHVIPFAGGMCWEPAAGEGHMAAVLAERFDEVLRTDVHDYGGLHAVGSFVGEGADIVPSPNPQPDWVITNPPFKLGLEFALRALVEADNVALLVRTAWLEGRNRYERLFRDRPPSIVAPFVERVPMVKGRWDPEASTATAYAWVVWEGIALDTRLEWIPPSRERLTHPDDARRFCTDDASGPAGRVLP